MCVDTLQKSTNSENISESIQERLLSEIVDSEAYSEDKFITYKVMNIKQKVFQKAFHMSYNMIMDMKTQHQSDCIWEIHSIMFHKVGLISKRGLNSK